MCFQRPRRIPKNQTSMIDISLIDTSRSLPSDFAIRVIEREIKLEKQPNEEVIHDLVNLYSLAIEHYSLTGDEKAKDYQTRMHKMLKKPEIMATLSPTKNKEINVQSPKIQSKTESPLVTPEKTVSEEKKEINPITVNNKQSFETKMIENTVKDKEINDKEIGDKLAVSLKSQEIGLKERLHLRQTSKVPANLIFDDSPTLEIDSPKSFVSESFEKDMQNVIEDIMEKSYEEKSNKIAEIKMKYLAEMEGMEDTGMMGLVMAQMKQNMKEEIDQVNTEYDERRKNELKKFKEDYFHNKSKLMQLTNNLI